MKSTATVADVVPGLQDATFALHIPLDGVDFEYGGTAVSLWATASKEKAEND